MPPTPTRPTYLRVVVTPRCSLACSYCHREGDAASAQPATLRLPELRALCAVGLRQGVRKLKMLGGEPLLRRDLPELIADLRARDPGLDLSVITAGAVDPQAVDRCFAAGLSRANLSVHGFGEAAFQARTGAGARAFAMRAGTLARLLVHGRFLKLNFVWRGPQDDADLGALLAWAADKSVVVGVLDDLTDPSLGPDAVLAAVVRQRGRPGLLRAEPDPHSLPTTRARWSDGLEVEIKSERLGAHAPWAACGACPVRAQCREGILALRLTHEGRLQPCLDRADLGVDLRGPLRAGGEAAAEAVWADAVARWTGAAARVAAGVVA
jgi:cyclic pyranopterin phosphate synthase